MNQLGKVNLVCGQVNFWYALSCGQLLLQKNPKTLDVRQVGGFLRVFRFPPAIKLTFII